MSENNESINVFNMYLLSFISLATCRDQDTDRQTWFLPSESFLEWHILPKPLFVERGKVAHPNITRIVCLFTFHLVWHREDVIFTKNTCVCKIVPLSRHVGLCVVWFLWCEYTFHGYFQVTVVPSLPGHWKDLATSAYYWYFLFLIILLFIFVGG